MPALKDIPLKNLVQSETTVSVKDFGAIGDGSTDDTTSIQSAIDYAWNNSIREVILPESTYLVSAAIIVRSHTHLRGIGKCVLFLNANSNSDVIQTANIEQSPLARNKDIVIEGIEVNGNKGGQSIDPIVNPYSGMSSIAGIRIVNTDGFEVRNCHSHDSVGYGIEVKSSSNGRIVGSTFAGAGDDGVSIADGSYPVSTVGIVVDSCVANDNGESYTNSGNSGFEVDDGPNDITFINCRASGNRGRGFEIHNHNGVAAGAVRRIRYINCYARANNAPEGFTFRTSAGFSTGYFFADQPAYDISYTGCHSEGHHNNEFSIAASSTDAITMTRLTIQDCTAIYSNTGPLDGSAERAVILLNGGIEDVRISNNRLYGTTNTVGILAALHTSGNVLIDNNLIDACHRGILVRSNKDVILSSNTVKATSSGTYKEQEAIFVESANTFIARSNFVKVDTTYLSGGIGTGSTLPVTKSLIQGNVLEAAPSGVEVANNGIHTKSSPSKILDNTIEGFSTGIRNTSASTKVLRNDVRGCTASYAGLSPNATTGLNLDSNGISIDEALFMSNTTAPATNLTNGGVLYVEEGALKYRSPNGTVTIIASA